jgi:hypothetical protein
MDIEFPLRLVWLGDIVDVQKRKGKREKGEEKSGTQRARRKSRGHGGAAAIRKAPLQKGEKRDPPNSQG